jgi:hypothetical protein
MTCALVTMMPSARITNPEPMPALRRSPLRPPMKYSKRSTGARSTVSVCTVTTVGATRSTAVVIAVRRDAGIDCAGRAPLGSAGVAVDRGCAFESAGLAPSHPTRSNAASATVERRGDRCIRPTGCTRVTQTSRSRRLGTPRASATGREPAPVVTCGCYQAPQADVPLSPADGGQALRRSSFRPGIEPCDGENGLPLR